MSRRSSLAFNGDDTTLAADLSKRAKTAADRIRALLPQLKAGIARRAGRVADDLTKIADTLHPVTARYATYGAGKRCFVALVDGRSMTLYRLLPCRKAGAFNVGMKQSVSRHGVREWPTLELAMAFAKIETAYRRKQDSIETSYWGAHRERERQHTRAIQALVDRAAKVKP